MNAAGSASAALDCFVDEAGDPRLFGTRGRVRVASPGCPRHFMLGVLQVAAP